MDSEVEEVRTWQQRFPLRVCEADLRGLHKHLSSVHGEVRIKAHDSTGVHEVTIDDMVGGRLWIGVSTISFLCTSPDLQVFIRDEIRCPFRMSWQAAANESARVVRMFAISRRAPLQLPGRLGWTIAAPVAAWWLSRGVIALLHAPIDLPPKVAVGSGAPPQPPALPAGSSVGSQWWKHLLGVAVGICGGTLLGRLLYSLEEFYLRLFPAVFFDLPWSTQWGDASRWAAICLYLSGVTLIWSAMPPW